jgi:hypothetical protein
MGNWEKLQLTLRKLSQPKLWLGQLKEEIMHPWTYNSLLEELKKNLLSSENKVKIIRAIKENRMK